MNIVFLSANYPSPARPFEGTFVQQFVWAMARQGNRCLVIKPTSVFSARYGRLPPLMDSETSGDNSTVKIIRPPYLTFSSRNLHATHTGRWTQRSYNLAVRMAMLASRERPTIVYGHFLYSAGYAATLIGKTYQCPAVIGVGESSPWTINAYGPRLASEHFSESGYFLANSTPNKEMLEDLVEIASNRIEVQANGVDLKCMYRRDQRQMREKYGIDLSCFVVGFIGANNDRKGPDRVSEAVRGLGRARCVLVGNGTESLRSDHVVWCGSVTHKIVPELLACMDVFVLPTTAEGSCNAVIEAMACGVPIVTSKGKYMDDIVDNKVAIRVDPSSVTEIREAIQVLMEDPDRRQRMSEACLAKAKQFDINERAKRVTAWMKELVRMNRR